MVSNGLDSDHVARIAGDIIPAPQSNIYNVSITLVKAKGTKIRYSVFWITPSAGKRIDIVDFLYRITNKIRYNNKTIVA